MGRALTVFVLLLGISCVEPYAPPISDEQAAAIMVVDGFIDGTNNIATVKLSYGTALADKKGTQRIKEAHVWIEDEQQNTIEVPETTTGIYTTHAAFNTESKYQLHIDAGTGTEYHSDFVSILPTPPIDSVTWEADKLDVVMYVSTHDPDNKTSYFKWDFVETYEYTAPFESKVKLVNGEAISRPLDESIFTCWKSENSLNITTTSIEQLGTKVVNGYPIHRLAGDDVKLWRVYSLLVRQQSLDRDGYIYWSTLKKINQELGGLFDPMPAEVRGNIHSSNPGERVLGYFSASEVTEKRMFIQFYDLPDPILHLTREKVCGLWIVSLEELKYLGKDILLKDPVTDYYGFLIGYQAAYEYCLDCRVYRKGTLQKPDYWPSVTF